MDVIKNQQDIRERIILALDVKTKEEMIELLHKVENQIHYVKVGMELFYFEGPAIIEALKKRGLKIFLDLKMHDIPTTVGKAAAQLTKMEVDMFNLHIAGGLEMMIEARNQMEKVMVIGQTKPLLLGVTQLTSTSQQTMQEEIGIQSTIEDTVIHYASLAKQAGLDGVVSSPIEVRNIKKQIGQDFLTVTPGIRLKENQVNDQKRVTTPEQAFQLGTDYIVVGRAITHSKHPAEAVYSIIKQCSIK